MRLLIVEDEKQLCDTVAKSLYDAGYEVDTCYDGETALDCILAENYDLVVLDLNLPALKIWMRYNHCILMSHCKFFEIGECPMFCTTTSNNDFDSWNACYNIIPIFKSAIDSITNGNNCNFCRSIAL